MNTPRHMSVGYVMITSHVTHPIYHPTCIYIYTYVYICLCVYFWCVYAPLPLASLFFLDFIVCKTSGRLKGLAPTQAHICHDYFRKQLNHRNRRCMRGNGTQTCATPKARVHTPMAINTQARSVCMYVYMFLHTYWMYSPSCLYMYISAIYKHVCIYMYIYTYTYTYAYVFTCMYICSNIYIYIYFNGDKYAGKIWMCKYLHVFAYILNIYTFVSIHVHLRNI